MPIGIVIAVSFVLIAVVSRCDQFLFDSFQSKENAECKIGNAEERQEKSLMMQ